MSLINRQRRPGGRGRWLGALALGWMGFLLAGVALGQDAEVTALPYFDSSEFTPRWLKGGDLPKDLHRIPEFALSDQRGEAITASMLDGKISVVNFFFTTCGGICPRLTRSVAQVDRALPEGAPMLLLSHSVTPEHDTVEVLKAYAAQNRITSPRWHLLTGERSAIYALGRQAYFVEEAMGEARGPEDFLHTESIVLIDEDRHIRGVYNGLNQASVTQLIADATQLLEALAAKGRAATP